MERESKKYGGKGSRTPDPTHPMGDRPNGPKEKVKDLEARGVEPLTLRHPVGDRPNGPKERVKNMEARGVEPLTFSLRTRRSTN